MTKGTKPLLLLPCSKILLDYIKKYFITRYVTVHVQSLWHYFSNGNRFVRQSSEAVLVRRILLLFLPNLERC